MRGDAVVKEEKEERCKRHTVKTIVRGYGEKEDVASACLASHIASNETAQGPTLPPAARGMHRHCK